jgi:hypothetical protein
LRLYVSSDSADDHGKLDQRHANALDDLVYRNFVHHDEPNQQYNERYRIPDQFQ